jgi:hypothetical protein
MRGMALPDGKAGGAVRKELKRRELYIFLP